MREKSAFKGLKGYGPILLLPVVSVGLTLYVFSAVVMGYDLKKIILLTAIGAVAGFLYSLMFIVRPVAKCKDSIFSKVTQFYKKLTVFQRERIIFLKKKAAAFFIFAPIGVVNLSILVAWLFGLGSLGLAQWLLAWIPVTLLFIAIGQPVTLTDFMTEDYFLFYCEGIFVRTAKNVVDEMTALVEED